MGSFLNKDWCCLWKLKMKPCDLKTLAHVLAGKCETITVFPVIFDVNSVLLYVTSWHSSKQRKHISCSEKCCPCYYCCHKLPRKNLYALLHSFYKKMSPLNSKFITPSILRTRKGIKPSCGYKHEHVLLWIFKQLLVFLPVLSFAIEVNLISLAKCIWWVIHKERSTVCSLGCLITTWLPDTCL